MLTSRHTSLVDWIGRTPLVRLRRFETREGVELYAKLEMKNPGGSVKDRAARAMMLDGERTGALGGGRILLDATSGNTGIAYAMLGAARGHRVRLCVPSNVTPERKRLLQVYGADLVLHRSDGRQRRRHPPGARDLRARSGTATSIRTSTATRRTGGRTSTRPASRSSSRPAAASRTSSRDSARAARSSARAAVSARRSRTSRLISVQPDTPLHGLEGLKHMQSAIVPGIYDASLADVDARVSTEASHALDAPARARGRTVRRPVERRGARRGPRRRATLSIRASSWPSSRTAATGTSRTRLWDAVEPTGDDAAREGEPRRTCGSPKPELVALRRHAARIYPNECCGALLGPAPGHVTRAFPLDNTFPDQQRRRFLVGPEEYRRAEVRAGDMGLQLLGFYHSHPDHPAEPSQFDLDHAWPNLSYLIVSVRQGQPKEARSWRLKIDRSAFEEEFVN